MFNRPDLPSLSSLSLSHCNLQLPSDCLFPAVILLTKELSVKKCFTNILVNFVKMTPCCPNTDPTFPFVIESEERRVDTRKVENPFLFQEIFWKNFPSFVVLFHFPSLKCPRKVQYDGLLFGDLQSRFLTLNSASNDYLRAMVLIVILLL